MVKHLHFGLVCPKDIVQEVLRLLLATLPNMPYLSNFPIALSWTSSFHTLTEASRVWGVALGCFVIFGWICHISVFMGVTSKKCTYLKYYSDSCRYKQNMVKLFFISSSLLSFYSLVSLADHAIHNCIIAYFNVLRVSVCHECPLSLFLITSSWMIPSSFLWKQ